MTHEQLMAFYSTQSAAALALGVTQSTISYWAKHGIPLEAQVAAEVDSKGVLRADLPEQVRAS